MPASSNGRSPSFSRISATAAANPPFPTDRMPWSSSNSSTHSPVGIDQIGAPVGRSPIDRDETFCPVHASKNLGNATRLHGFLAVTGSSGRSCVQVRAIGGSARPKESGLSPTSCSRPGSRTASRRSTTAAPASTRWRSCGHYERWREDFDCVEELGIHFLRYGPPLHRTLLGPGKYDWEFADLTFAELKRRDITPIVDLCHFGVPDWIGNFQNPDFPQLFAHYAGGVRRALSRGCSSTRRSTRCSSARSSRPNTAGGTSRLTDDRRFVTALKHIVKANVLAMIEILKRRARRHLHPDANRSEYFHADSPAAIGQAELLNSRRFLQPRPQLRPPRRQRDVRISDGQRHDPGGISLLPRPPAQAALHPRQRLLHAPTSIACSPTAIPTRRARCSATARSPANITTATGCR